MDETYPGAHFAAQGVQYTCVAGRTVKGFRELDEQVRCGACVWCGTTWESGREALVAMVLRM